MPLWIYPSFLLVLVISAARPHWGFAILVSILPLEALLPRGSVMVMGAVALVGALGRLLGSGALRVRPNRALVFGLAFLVWLLMTHPAATWEGLSGRNWVFTFVQLLGIAFLASATLDTREKHLQVLFCFAIACAVSAAFAISLGDIFEARNARSSGLALGENTAARYFSFGMVVWLFGAWITKQWVFRAACLGGAVLLMIGIVYTGSRTGLALGCTAIVLVPFMGRHLKTGRWLLTVGAFALAGVTLLPSGTFDTVTSWFQLRPDVGQGQFEGLEGNIRFYVWQAALQLWRENPIAGVGLDGFVRAAPNYVHLNLREHVFDRLTPHNTYVTLLAETGAVGLLLFLGTIGSSLLSLWRAYRADSSPGPPAIWLLCFVLILAGATLKNDFAEKLLWVTVGAAISLTPVREELMGREPLRAGFRRFVRRAKQSPVASAWRPSVIQRPKAAGSRRIR